MKVVEYRPIRKRLPKRRPSQTTSFAVGGAEGYLTAGSYPDDGLGEIFLKFGKQGSTLAGVMDAFSIAVSIGLQYGVPLETFVEKFTNLRFEPAGLTDDPDVRMAQSIMDYVFRRLALDYLDFDTRSVHGHPHGRGACSPARDRLVRAGRVRRVDDDLEDELRARCAVGAGLAKAEPGRWPAGARGRRGQVRRRCGLRGRGALLGRADGEAQRHGGRRADVHDLRHQDASRRLLLRLRGLRQHQRLQLRCDDDAARPRPGAGGVRRSLASRRGDNRDGLRQRSHRAPFPLVHFVGIDLAWGQRQPTGLAVLDADGAPAPPRRRVRTDEEIADALEPYVDGPCLVGIDAPARRHQRHRLPPRGARR